MTNHKIEDSLSIEELRALVPQLQSLTQEYKRKERVQQALINISDIASTSTDLNSLYPIIHQQIDSLIEAENFMVVLYSEQPQVLEFVYVADQYYDNDVITIESPKLEQTLSWQVVKSAKPLYLKQESLTEELQRLNVPLDTIGAAPVDWLGAPLIDNGSVIGALVIQRYDTIARYDDEDLELLNFVCQHVVNAISRVKRSLLTEETIAIRTEQLRISCDELQQEIEERERIETLQQALFEISELSASADSNVEMFYKNLHDIVARLILAPNCYIATVSWEQKYLTFEYYSDAVNETQRGRKLHKGITEYLLQSGDSLIVDSTKAELLSQQGHISQTVAEQFVAQSACWLGVPLIIDGSVFGCVVVQSYDNNELYDEQDLEVLRYVSHHIATAIQRKRTSKAINNYNKRLEDTVAKRTEAFTKINFDLQQQIENNKRIEKQLVHEANHDALTGLPNRVMFSKELSALIDKKKRFPYQNKALLFIDLDGFKQINDNFGHHVGDEYLIETVSRIRDSIRSYDTIGRLGGDEFIVLLDEYDQLSDVFDICERIISAVSEPYAVLTRTIHAGASIGIVEINEQYENPDSVIRDADAAMYQAKFRGKGVSVLFDDGIRDSLDSKYSTEQQFREALKSQTLTPQISLINEPDSNETLIKTFHFHWSYQDTAFNFAGIADIALRCGLSQKLDLLVISHMLAAFGDAPGDCPINIPMSVINVKNYGFMDNVIERINNTELPLTQVIITLNERDVPIKDYELIAAMQRLVQYGIRFLLSDFMAHSGGLNNLIQYPFTFVRLTRSQQYTSSTEGQMFYLKAIEMIAMLGNTVILPIDFESDTNRKRLKGIDYLIQQSSN